MLRWLWLILQAKIVGATGHYGNFSGYDEYVPMVDKAVDSGWKKPTAAEKFYVIEGLYVISCFKSSIFTIVLVLSLN